jgi:hypothetical protein
MEVWTPVIIKHFGISFENEVFKRYEVSNMCRIRKRVNKRISISKNEKIKFTDGIITKGLRTHRVCLASFFPNKIPKNISEYDVDHIDGNHLNQNLNNLQWILKSEHTKKTWRQTAHKRKRSHLSRGKKVKIIEIKRNGCKNLIGKVFNSSALASDVCNVASNTIRQSAKLGCWAGEYKFKFVDEKKITNEIFVDFGRYKVSNKGRYITTTGVISKGSKHNGKYRRASITNYDGTKKFVYMHRLVWIAFNGEIPDNMVVMHDDTIDTLDDEGYELNWLEHLSLGTKQENAQSYHDNK